MNIDLRPTLSKGIENLVTWRNRYSKNEYPEKVVLNIFYRKYTMEFIWNEINSCFETNFLGNPKKKWNDFGEGLSQLRLSYSNTAQNKTAGVLEDLLKKHDRSIGLTNYGIFVPLINAAQKGDTSKIEEIEYSYLYYLLADEAILVWAALGGTGISKLDVIAQITGVLFDNKIESYANIEQVLGHYGVSTFMNENYRSLPSFT